LAKECYGSRINKDELIGVTIGLAKPMREGDLIGCLFNGPKKLEDSQGGSSVRGDFRVTSMRFMLQRYSHIEETHPVKISITDIRWTPHHAVEIPWQVGILKSGKKTKKWKLGHRCQIWLECKRQSENSILELIYLESNQNLNTIVI
jgi:hypothetical protein